MLFIKETQSMRSKKYKNVLNADLEALQNGARQDSSSCSERWLNGCAFGPSIIPISLIAVLFLIVFLLPSTKIVRASEPIQSTCNIQIVESIPEGLTFPNDSPKFMSTFEAWQTLFDKAQESLHIGSFYWTLRGIDVINHTSAHQGEEIFERILSNGLDKKLDIRIAQSAPTPNQPNIDTEIFSKAGAANVRSVDFPRLLHGGVLHTKVWIVDNKHFYLGSANMDWRALTQVKELGVLAQNCSDLALDLSKIFEAYWYLGQNSSSIPKQWPNKYSTTVNAKNPMQVTFNNDFTMSAYLSNSPPPLSAKGRTNDLDAILGTISSAESFVHIAVMDYFPLLLYTPRIKYWPYIDDALRTAAIEKKVSIKMLISWWKHSNPSEDFFLRSLKSLSSAIKGVDIEIKRFIVPTDEDQRRIPFGRVNHNKYMVTDNTAYIGTSNWSGDYFTDTAGIGLVLRDNSSSTSKTLRADLAAVFERDWNSPYAVDLQTN